MSWTPDLEEVTGFGLYGVRVWDTWVERPDFTGSPIDRDVTFVRDVPTVIQEYSFTDPFGPATATLVFPSITNLDSLADFPWLKKRTNVDIYYYPCSEDSWTPDHGHGEQTVLNPLTNDGSLLYVHEWDQDGVRVPPVWEGFIYTRTPQPIGTTVVCKGAAFQLDDYYAKPISPLRPKRVEEMIARYFDPARRGIWLAPIDLSAASPMWDRFTREYTQWDANRLFAQGGLRFLPTAAEGTGDGIVATQDDNSGMELGTPWTTFLTRSTGGWDKALTSYVQPMLATMYAMPSGSDLQKPGEPDQGTDITDGDSWTIDVLPGRRPQFRLKRQADDSTLVAWCGQPGVEDNLTEDAGQSYNTVFAQGVGPDGTTWNEVVPMENNSFVSWQPLYPEAASGGLYRGWEDDNDLSENYDGYAARDERASGTSVVERYVSDFPSGIDEEDARRIAGMWARRDAEPGWSGTIVLTHDLRDTLGNIRTKESIRQGDVLWLKGFQGVVTETIGVNKFYVTQVNVDPIDGTVTLTVDTKFRDALTYEHAKAGARDTLSVINSLRTGQMTNQIQDLAAPWSPNKGAGVMPTPSHSLWTATEQFPYTDFTTTVGNRPRDHFKAAFKNAGSGFDGGSLKVVKMLRSSKPNKPEPANALSLTNAVVGENLETHGLYVPVQAGAANKNRRWAFFPVLLANAGTIMRTEFAAYDKDGNLAPVEFHVSMYAVPVTQTEMPSNPAYSPGAPHDPANTYSALWDGAFEKVRRNGTPWPPGEEEWHWGTPAQRIGWGTYDRPCGYSPGTKDFDDLAPTGMMVDGGPWTFDMTDNNEWSSYQFDDPDNPTRPIPKAAISYTVAIYAHIPGREELGDPTDDTGLNWVYFRGRVFRSVNIGTGS